jgi:hypothetical protein
MWTTSVWKDAQSNESVKEREVWIIKKGEHVVRNAIEP